LVFLFCPHDFANEKFYVVIKVKNNIKKMALGLRLPKMEVATYKNIENTCISWNYNKFSSYVFHIASASPL
jgi:hypothetical protein